MAVLNKTKTVLAAAPYSDTSGFNRFANRLGNIDSARCVRMEADGVTFDVQRRTITGGNRLVEYKLSGLV